MNKPNVSEVQTIIDTDLSDSQIQAFIDAANLTMDETFDSGDLGAGLLTELNKWLAAHLLSTRDKRVAKEAINDVEITYQGKTGLGLDATSYGQQVKTLDPTGKLANLSTKESNVEITSWS